MDNNDKYTAPTQESREDQNKETKGGIIEEKLILFSRTKSLLFIFHLILIAIVFIISMAIVGHVGVVEESCKELLIPQMCNSSEARKCIWNSTLQICSEKELFVFSFVENQTETLIPPNYEGAKYGFLSVILFLC